VTDFNLGDIVAEIAHGSPVTVVEPDSAEATRAPAEWQEIATADEAGVRCSAALGRWNPSFLALVPRFAELFTARLVDVRLCLLGEQWVLVYIARGDGESWLTWIGWSPWSSVTTRTPFWESVPEPAREFLTTAHGGFTGADWESFGLVRPAHLTTTYAAWADLFDEALADWDEDAELSATRMAVITTNGGMLAYCVSPDLPEGRVALVYEDDIDTEQTFGDALDELMCERFTL
jgi:hypothetical protein